MESRLAHRRRWVSLTIAAILLGAALLVGSQTAASALDLSPFIPTWLKGRLQEADN